MVDRIRNCDPALMNRVRVVDTEGRLVTELNAGEYATVLAEPGEHTYFAKAWLGKCAYDDYRCVGTMRATLDAGRAYFVTIRLTAPPMWQLVKTSDVLDFIPIAQEQAPNFRSWLGAGNAMRVELDLGQGGGTGLAHWSNGNIATLGAMRIEQAGGRIVRLGDPSRIEWPE